jgi:hypothetical protein
MTAPVRTISTGEANATAWFNAGVNRVAEWVWEPCAKKFLQGWYKISVAAMLGGVMHAQRLIDTDSCLTNAMYARVIQDVASGALKPDERGFVTDLGTPPGSWPCQKVYAVKGTDGNPWLVFYLARGRHANFTGFLHVPKPVSMTINEDEFDSSPDYESGSIRYNIERKINDHWYVVGYHMD